MTKESLIEQFAGITDATPANISQIYEALDFLGIPFKKTSCKRCRQDLLNIVREELGLIESAAEESSFNSDGDKCYRYLLDRAQTWEGHLINKDTPLDVVKKFIKKFPKGYFEIAECPEESGL